MPHMKTIFTSLLLATGLFASPYMNYAPEPKIGVQNAILARVNGKTISMLDVKKKMDLFFYQNFPQHADSAQTKLQFYMASWKQVLREMIDHELIVSDALDKEIKLTDGDIREAMEERFGPSVMQTLDRIGLTYEEAWDMVRDELIVQRMNWWFIQSKAMSSVCPQDIRQAYRHYLEENPAYAEWTYQIISLKADHLEEATAQKIYQALLASGKAPDSEFLKSLEAPGLSISLSNEFVVKSQDLSEKHQAILADLLPGNYSQPALQQNRSERYPAYRIFYLAAKTDHPAPSFEALSQKLRNDLVQEAIVQTSGAYLAKLRKFYGFDGDQAIPEDLQPFSIQ